ncbi:MAG: hypothetical protein ACI8Z5_002666 [Lentimonas sp.]|jgi:hypothetical protein
MPYGKFHYSLMLVGYFKALSKAANLPALTIQHDSSDRHDLHAVIDYQAVPHALWRLA